MELKLAAEVACRLMRNHGLLSQGWQFKMEPQRQTWIAGCDPDCRLIVVEEYSILRTGPYEFEQIMLHEIAHALTPGDGHGEHWRRKCAGIGAPCWGMVWRGYGSRWRALGGICFFEPTRNDCVSVPSAVAYIRRTRHSKEAEYARYFWFRTPRSHVGLWIDPQNGWFVTIGDRVPKSVRGVNAALEEAATWLWIGFRTVAHENKNVITEKPPDITVGDARPDPVSGRVRDVACRGYRNGDANARRRAVRRIVGKSTVAMERSAS